MGYRLIALDIDGTIRTTERPISARTRKVIEALGRRGAVVTAATGRTFPSAVAAINDLGITAPIVSYQGAHIAYPNTAEIIWHRPLTASMAHGALDALAAWKTEVLAYVDNRVYANTFTPWVEAYSERNRNEVEVTTDLRQLAGEGITRLLAVGADDDVDALAIRLTAEFDSRLQITRSLPFFCKILHPDAGKHKALEWLSRHLGVPQDQTVAIGNGPDDAEMLRWAGLGVAIQGAPTLVTEAADRVVPPVEDDGAAWVLEELLEQGLVG